MKKNDSFKLLSRLENMKLITLTFLFLSVFFLSCSKSEQDDSSISERVWYPSNISDDLMNDYDLWNSDVYYDKYIPGVDKKTIFFYTCVDNRLFLVGYDMLSKKQVMYSDDINVDTIVTINKPYGETIQFKREKVYIPNIYKVGNSYSFVLYLTDDSLIFSHGTGYLNIISDGENYQIQGYEKIMVWCNNIIVHSLSEDKYVCFSLNGQKIFDISNMLFSDLHRSKKHLAINIYEGVFLGKNNQAIKKVNIKTGEILWQKEDILEDLPDNIRIDETTFNPTDENFISLTFKYTFYDGTKGEREYKVNLKSGELTLL